MADPVWLRGLRFGVAASVEHRRLPIDPTTRTVLDVGANRGQFALYASRCCPQALIHCFEPLPGPCATLRRLFHGRPQVHVHQTAVGQAAGESTIHVSARDDSSSLLPITSLQVERFPGTQQTRELTVPVVRLDRAVRADAIQPPVLLKIDVQGYELEVLAGATGLLPRLSQIVLEASFEAFYQGQPLFHDLHRWLDGRGFFLAAAAASALDPLGGWRQADVLYRRDPAPAGTG